MFIEKYTVVIADQSSGKQIKKLKVDADDVYSAHKKALDELDLYKEDVLQILNFDNKIVYDLDKGFLE
jgi:hypothetical protein